MAQKAYTTITPVDTSEIEAVAALAKHCSNDTWRETTKILKWYVQGVSISEISTRLGIGRSTAYRRLSTLKSELHIDKGPVANDAFWIIKDVLREIDDLCGTAFREFEIARSKGRDGCAEHQKLAARFLRQAIDTADLKTRVLERAGFLKQIAVQMEIRANKLAQTHVEQDMIKTNLALLDENQRLRENLEALKEGRPEPDPDGGRLDIETLRETLETKSRENSETLSAADIFQSKSTISVT
jgi:hypothetical protein